MGGKPCWGTDWETAPDISAFQTDNLKHLLVLSLFGSHICPHLPALVKQDSGNCFTTQYQSGITLGTLALASLTSLTLICQGKGKLLMYQRNRSLKYL